MFHVKQDRAWAENLRRYAYGRRPHAHGVVLSFDSRRCLATRARASCPCVHPGRTCSDLVLPRAGPVWGDRAARLHVSVSGDSAGGGHGVREGWSHGDAGQMWSHAPERAHPPSDGVPCRGEEKSNVSFGGLKGPTPEHVSRETRPTHGHVDMATAEPGSEWAGEWQAGGTGEQGPRGFVGMSTW